MPYLLKRWAAIAVISSSLGLVGAQDLSKQDRVKLSSCPNDIQTLTEQLLRDLPSYANRVMQRSRRKGRSLDIPVYVIVAGRPEFEPLPLRQVESQYSSRFTDTTEQVFFTTLERQYGSNHVTKLQNYHWLFLTLTKEGWQLVTIHTQLASVKPGDVPLPPRESRNGVVGQAIGLWLRDCQAGTLRG